MTSKRPFEPDSCLIKTEVDLLQQTRAWAEMKLVIVTKLRNSYPNDVRITKERETLVELVKSCNKVLYFYAL